MHGSKCDCDGDSCSCCCFFRGVSRAVITFVSELSAKVRVRMKQRRKEPRKKFKGGEGRELTEDRNDD